MSSLPQASMAVWTSASGAPGCVRSPPWTTVSASISPAACSARSASRSLMSTLAPCSASSSAVARPMPRADPVTIATLSSRTPMDPFRLRLQAVRAADDLEHDLVGARADAVQAQVAPGALHAVLAHVAGAPVDLQALVGDLAGDARREQLGHRDLAHRVLAVGEAPGGRVVELARGLELGRHLGELVAADLELPDRPAEGGALAGVGERLVEQPLRAGDGQRGADHALALELPHDVLEALADRAEDRAVGHADVLEGEQRRVGGVHAELDQLLLADDAGRVHVDQEEREAVVAGLGVGLGDEDDVV